MAISKVAVSLPAPLLERIDRLAKRAGVSRSAFVREAVERRLRQPVETEIVGKARRIYARIGRNERTLSESWLALAAETLPRPPKRRKR